MPTIQMNILENARKDCQEIIDYLKTMPMSNIVNAIEQIKACQTIIKPIETEEITNTCLATCDISILTGKHEKNNKVIEKKFRHHFIHYEKSKNKELEKIRVAHELGHCYGHWPLNERKEEGRIHSDIIPDVNIPLYIIEFNKPEEAYADAFASIMVNYPFSPSEQYPDVIINKKLLDKIEEYAKKGYLQSPFVK